MSEILWKLSTACVKIDFDVVNVGGKLTRAVFCSYLRL